MGAALLKKAGVIILAAAAAWALVLMPTQGRAEKDKAKPWYENLSPQWGGHIKLRTRASFPDDQSYYKKVDAEDMYDGFSELRLKNKVFFGQWGSFETHYEAVATGGDTLRKRSALAALYPGWFRSGMMGGKQIEDDRRVMDLTKTISSDDSYVFYHRLDRLNFTWQPSWGTVRIGRQAITWGNGMLFNPMDLFNPFAPTDFTRDYKVGDDMVFTQVAYGEAGYQFLYAPRRDPGSGDIEWNQSSLAGKVHLAKGVTEFDLMFARHYRDYVAGAGATGYVGDAAWRVNATCTILDDKSRNSAYWAMMANLDYSWIWWGKNFYGWIELAFNSLGKDEYAEALEDPDLYSRLERGEMFTLGRLYADAELKAELHPLFTVYFTLITNLHDPSGIFQPRAVWDMTQNGQVTFGGNIYLGGSGTEYGGFSLPGGGFNYGAPNSAYLWYTYFF